VARAGRSPGIPCRGRFGATGGAASIAGSGRAAASTNRGGAFTAPRTLRSFVQGADLAPHRQPLERARLDLADALARQPEDAADLLERLRVGVAVEAVAELEHHL